jgi:hypothetical protein
LIAYSALVAHRAHPETNLTDPVDKHLVLLAWSALATGPRRTAAW